MSVGSGGGGPAGPVATVTLPMYDLPEVATATAAMAEAMAAAVTAAGWAAQAAPTAFATHAELEAHWLDRDVAVTHACGLPLREALAGRVEALGTFVWRGVSRPDGWYRSVVVVRAGLAAVDPAQLRGARPAVNHPQSLSGWASLGWALAEAGLAAGDLAPVVRTGGHVASLTALADGRADVASIDGATWALLSRLRPGLVAGVRVIGAGPWVPATPLVSPAGGPATPATLRAAVRRAVADPALAPALDALGIEAFVPLASRDYAVVDAVTATAERALPRVGTHDLTR